MMSTGFDELERKMGIKPNQIPADVPVGMALHYATEEQRALDAAVEPRRLAFLAARRARKMHIRGPYVGGLWIACFPGSSGLGASGMSPEGAYRNWFSYWGKMV